MNCGRTEFETNRLLLKNPRSRDKDDLDIAVQYYLNDNWYYDYNSFLNQDFIIDYLLTIFDNKIFDFANYSVKDHVGEKIYPFAEIEKDHEKCCEKIYFERIYTRFGSSVFSYKGKVYSFLKLFITHRDLLKKMKKYDRADQVLSNLIIKNMDDSEITDADHTAINNAFDAFISHFGKQTIYAYDEVLSRGHSMVSLLISLYLEFFITVNDTVRINKLFEFFHTTGNIKAETFSKLLKEENEKTNYTERPISGYRKANNRYGADNTVSLIELYYFIDFYKSFKNGKFLKNIVLNRTLLPDFISAFKAECEYKINNKLGRFDKKFFTQFNSIKPERVYTLETFERFNTLIINKITGTTVLDILEQDASVLQLCLLDPEINTEAFYYGFNTYSVYYNFLNHIEYDKLPESQKQRYWKMISNFINTTTLKSKRLLEVLSKLTKLHNITEAELVAHLQPYVLLSKQTLLLELYLD